MLSPISETVLQALINIYNEYKFASTEFSISTIDKFYPKEIVFSQFLAICKDLEKNGYLIITNIKENDIKIDISQKALEYFDHKRVAQAAEVAALAQKEQELQDKYRHDWLIAAFGTIGGAIMGLITSIVFWLITT